MSIDFCDFHSPNCVFNTTEGQSSNEENDKNKENAIGIHNMDLTCGQQSIEELLRKAPQQVKKRQIEQQGDLIRNIYNMGSGMRTSKFDEAAELMFKRTYPEIESNNQSSPIFIPETFIPRVPIGVDLENYKDQFEKLSDDDKKIFNLKDMEKELDGDMVEKRLYEEVSEFYKNKEVVVLQGAELLIPIGKKGHKQESDFIIINKKLKYIMNIEAKLTISNVKANSKRGSPIDSALNQLNTTKNILETYFSKDISPEWLFIGAIFYKYLDENANCCPECGPFLVKNGEIQRKLTLIESKIKRKQLEIEDAHKDYKTLVKHLVFTIFANPGPITKWNVADKIFETVTKQKGHPGQGEYRSILFWTPSQFQIMQLDEESHPCQRNVLFISSMSTGKTECMKGMIDRLLNEGHKCHFILYNQRCPLKTLLHNQLENYFHKNKNRDNLEFSYLNSDATDATGFYKDVKNVIWKHPGYHTFIDELTLPGKHKEISIEMQEIVQEMQRQQENPCLWITIAGMAYATREDFSHENMQKTFPDFFIPVLRFPLRNCKRVIKYVLGTNTQLDFDHDGDSGTSFLDIDVPDNLMEGLDPIDVGEGYSKELEKAMRLVGERHGERGVAVLFNYWSRSLGTKKRNKIVNSIIEGIKKAGRPRPVYYSCEIGEGVSEEELAEWIKERGNVDLVADLCVARGWEDRTVVVVDCNRGRGVENLYMRAISNLYVVRTEKKPEKKHIQEKEEEEEEELEIDWSEF